MLFIHNCIGQSKYLKSQGISNLRLASRAVRGEPVFPYLSALRAAESVGQKSESLIVVELGNSKFISETPPFERSRTGKGVGRTGSTEKA